MKKISMIDDGKRVNVEIFEAAAIRFVACTPNHECSIERGQ